MGSLPTGVTFDTATRVLSGTPTAVGLGTITIRATNSQGFDDWAVDYTTVSDLVAPSFSDPTGDAQNWTQNDAITAITVPSADGIPSPTYSVIGSLPTGLSFNITSRVISGTPTVAGSGTITIRATNSQGSDDWTVTYATSIASVTITTGNSTLRRRFL